MISKIVKSDLEIRARRRTPSHQRHRPRSWRRPRSARALRQVQAKLPLDLIDPAKVEKAKLVLVTAITPTPPGEEQNVGGPHRRPPAIGKKTTVVLREPSLGPVFGIKNEGHGERIFAGGADGRHQPALHRRFRGD